MPDSSSITSDHALTKNLPGAEGSRSDRWTTLLTCSVILGFVTTLLAAIPHLVSGLLYGEWAYWSNSDHMLYAANAKAALLGSWDMNDPFNAASEPRYLLYSWLQFVPLPHLLGTLGVGPDGLNLVWRICGGMLFGMAVFPLFHFGLKDLPKARLLSLFAGMIFVADPGAIEGRSFLQPLLLAQQRLTDPGLKIGDDLSLPQFRLVTPLTNVPFFLLALWAVLKSESRAWAAVAAILLGINVLLYFFFWTSLVGIILGLIALKSIAWLSNRSDERLKRQIVHLAVILVVGMLIGSPDILAKRQIQNAPGVAEILSRLCRGQALPPGDPFRFTYAYNTTFYAKFAVITLGLIRWRDPLYLLAWLGSLVGYFLCNAGIWAGLEFENFHWYYVCNPLSEIALLLISIRLVGHSRFAVPVLGVAATGFVLLCGAIRAYDSAVAHQPSEYRRMMRETESLLPTLQSLSLDGDAALIGPYEMDWLALHTRAFQLYQEPYTLHLTVLTEEETIRRHALNAYVMGLDRNAYVGLVAPLMCTGCLPTEPQWQPDEHKAARIRAFDALTPAIAEASLQSFSNVVVLNRANQGPPRGGDGWRQLASNDFWVLWRLEKP
jgi:hypothetical protein